MNILVPMKSLLRGLVQKIEENKNDILYGIGTVTEVAAVIYTASRSFRVVDIVQRGFIEEKKIYLTEKDEEQIESKQKKNRWKTLGKLSMEYLPTVGLTVISLYCHGKAHNNLKQEKLDLVGQLAGYGLFMTCYRGRVAEKIGPEAEQQLYYDTHKEKIEVSEVLEDGSEKTVKKSVDVVADNFDPKKLNELEGYQVWFTPETSSRYIESSRKGLHNANTELFKSCEQLMTLRLIARAADGDKFMPLDDPFEFLGLKKTKYSYNAGFTYDPDNPRGDNCVKIKWQEFYQAIRYFDDIEQKNMTRYIPVYLLEFNVDGRISDCPGRDEK